MSNQISKEDILDSDFFDAYELKSDGYSENSTYLSNVQIISTINATKIININLAPDGGGILYSKDHPVEKNDIVYLQGTSGADGYYTVNSIISDTSFYINENINDSTGGFITFKYPSGASRIGFNSSGLVNTTASNVQDAIKDIDFSISDFLSSIEHENLNTLTHNIAQDGYSLITYLNNDIINYTIWTNPSMITKIREYQISYTITPCNKKINQVITIQYDLLGSPLNTLTETVNYNGNKILSITSVKT